MPEETLELFFDHGTVAPVSEADLDDAESSFARLAECGIDIADVAEVLEDEGVAAFAAPSTTCSTSSQEKAARPGGASE